MGRPGETCLGPRWMTTHWLGGPTDYTPHLTESVLLVFPLYLDVLSIITCLISFDLNMFIFDSYYRALN